MVAYHFPPSSEVSGALRTLSMARYLGESGIRTIVLAPHQRAYPATNMSMLDMIPDCCEVERTFAVDIRQHLGVLGHYPIWLAQPDRWNSWWIGAVARGLKIIKRSRPKVIWSTYPIATSHLIAAYLHKMTGVPWIADFRDPITTPVGQEGGITARSRAWVERLTIEQANACVFVTDGACELYTNRYAQTNHGPFSVIPNGYDDESFDDSLQDNVEIQEVAPPCLTLLHSGALYPQGRNPESFLSALADLINGNRLSREDIRVVFRASGSETYFSTMLARYGLEEVVMLSPPIDRSIALSEQGMADGLLLFQGGEFNAQIPAKVYEYFRIGKPIFGIVDKEGDTAKLLQSEEVCTIASIEDSDEIGRKLLEFLAKIRSRTVKSISNERLARYSRRHSAEKLYDLIRAICVRY